MVRLYGRGMRQIIRFHWTKDGKRIMSIDYGHKTKEIVIGSVKIRKQNDKTIR